MRAGIRAKKYVIRYCTIFVQMWTLREHTCMVAVMNHLENIDFNNPVEIQFLNNIWPMWWKVLSLSHVGHRVKATPSFGYSFVFQLIVSDLAGIWLCRHCSVRLNTKGNSHEWFFSKTSPPEAVCHLPPTTFSRKKQLEQYLSQRTKTRPNITVKEVNETTEHKLCKSNYHSNKGFNNGAKADQQCIKLNQVRISIYK
jgi:hypothetical protein